MKLNDIMEHDQHLTEMDSREITDTTKILGYMFDQYMKSMNFVMKVHAFKDRLSNTKREDHITQNQFINTMGALVKIYGGEILNAIRTEKEYEGVVKNAANNINVVFGINYRPNVTWPQCDFKIITMKTKKNFRTKHGDHVFKVDVE
jgi:hypothetical protein